MPKYNKYRWNGKLVSESVYKQRLAQSNVGKNNKLKKPEETVEAVQPPSEGPGRRIVELAELGKQLWCVSCKEALSLDNIENECRKGLGSILSVRCHKCLLINMVSTSKKHASADGRRTRFDVNFKAAMGALHSGIGWTHLNKLLSCLNIPSIDFKTFKRYEDDVGETVESIAKESCEEAALIERQLTIQNAEQIEKSLPDSLKSGFIIPNQSTDTRSSTSTSAEPPSETQDLTTGTTPTTFDDVVRIMISYDMGWSTRGTGRNYDSLNGFGAIIGKMSNMILDYSTCNRKCKKCDNGNHPSDHKCALNFWGSAKAMEPHVANKLVNDSSILKSKNLEVGVLIGDDDSSTIAACRAGSSHPIVKLSDVNHTSKGVKNELYNIERNHKELTRDGITYLHRCFTYAVAQNRGNSATLAEAVRSIPYHTFNDHSKCSTWCGYIQNPENYDHKVVPGGFHDQQLFEALRNVFDRLAANAEKFASGASSNINESLNATMASKAPKSRCYSLTKSADTRFACAVAHKNVGEGYTLRCNERKGLSPGGNHASHVSRIQKVAVRRSNLIKTHEFKKKRMELKKHRSALRYRKESLEGVTYKSNCTLLSEPVVYTEHEPDISDEDEINNNVIDRIVLLDLETSGLNRDCDILQIAAKCGKAAFDVYINPTKEISASATQANGLTKCYGDLMYYGRKVPSVPLRIAIVNLLQWLTGLGHQCYIATHNLGFDGPKLYNAITSCSLGSDFSEIVCGFIDTLQVIKKHTKRTGKGACTVTGLAEWLNISTAGAHNAQQDVAMLEKILRKTKITDKILIEEAKNYHDQTRKWNSDKHVRNLLPALNPLKNTVGESIRKKLAQASITVDLLQDTYGTSGTQGVTQLLSKNRVTISKASVVKIIEYLKKKAHDN